MRSFTKRTRVGRYEVVSLGRCWRCWRCWRYQKSSDDCGEAMSIGYTPVVLYMSIAAITMLTEAHHSWEMRERQLWLADAYDYMIIVWVGLLWPIWFVFRCLDCIDDRRAP
jgi:hypothetical protein